MVLAWSILVLGFTPSISTAVQTALTVVSSGAFWKARRCSKTARRGKYFGRVLARFITRHLCTADVGRAGAKTTRRQEEGKDDREAHNRGGGPPRPHPPILLEIIVLRIFVVLSVSQFFRTFLFDRGRSPGS